MTSVSPRTFTLYRFWHYRDLLYVGKTTNPPARLKQHKKAKDWWETVTHITMEHHPNAASLHKAECIAILAERPAHNIDKPVWVINEERAKSTAVYVRERWGIPDIDEYKRLADLKIAAPASERLAEERLASLRRERRILDLCFSKREERDARQMERAGMKL